MPDDELVPEDFIVAAVVGACDGVWDGVHEMPGLQWRGNDMSAAIVFGITDLTSTDR